MLVGNDVVDLRDPESRPDTIHPRWDSRVFTPEERKRLALAPSLHRARWKMWAAKESAFKVARKIEPQLSFFPTSFAVEFCDSGSAPVGCRVVHAGVGRFDVRLQETVEYVHAVATREGLLSASSKVEALWLGSTARRESPATSLASRQVRDLARTAIGSVLDLDPCGIEISMVGGVPVARSGGAALPVDLSLSHHGRFVACAWLLLGATGGTDD